MSYEVIARRWRPKAFEMIVGQHHVTETLKNAIAADRMAHAFLFAGPRGVGKTTTARILAKALNCAVGTDADALRHLPTLRGYRDRPIRRRHRRSTAASNTSVDEDPRAPRERAVRARRAAVQDLHHRRSAHAVHQRLQRAA